MGHRHVPHGLNPLVIREELQQPVVNSLLAFSCLNPLVIREELQLHTLFLFNKISKLQGALGKNLLLTNRAMKHPRGTY